MNDFRDVPAELKKTVGMKINELKQLAIDKINELKENTGSAQTQNSLLDLTRTSYPIKLGTRHPFNACTERNHRNIPTNGFHSRKWS